MTYDEYDSHDEVIACRLMLAVIDDDDVAYATTMNEIRCLPCAHRVINALAHLLAWERMASISVGPDDPQVRAFAADMTANQLAHLLDEDDPPGGT